MIGSGAGGYPGGRPVRDDLHRVLQLPGRRHRQEEEGRPAADLAPGGGHTRHLDLGFTLYHYHFVCR